MAERIDFVTFDPRDAGPGVGSVDEAKRPVSLNTVGNARSTPGLFGAGYLEMLARQITRDLQHIRDRITAGRSAMARELVLALPPTEGGPSSRLSNSLMELSKRPGCWFFSL
jgi:hypothetical protein